MLEANLHPCAMAFDGHHRGRAALLEVLLPAVVPPVALVLALHVAFGLFFRWLSSRTAAGAPGYSSEGFLS